MRHRRTLSGAVLTALLTVSTGLAAAEGGSAMSLRTPQHRVLELSFDSSVSYGDPYNEVDLDLAVTEPDGTNRTVPAFWAGENRWKARIACDQAGTYRFRTACSNASDTGLHGREGAVEVEAAPAGTPLAGHGRLRVADDRRHLQHVDGTPFFWLADTWWMGLTTRLPWPDGFKALTADRVEKGFNVVQIIAGPYPDMDAWDPRGRNEAGFPFAEGFARINPAYYDHADLKIAHLVDSGIAPCIVGMWGYYLPQLGVDRVKRFWRHLVARYGAYPVVWCIAGEATMPYYLSENGPADAEAQKKGWTKVMASVKAVDGYRNVITIHPTQFGREQVEDPALMDLEMLQTGHGDLGSVPRTEDTVVKSLMAEPKMPVIVAEVNYEGIMGFAWQNVQRLCFYRAVLNGAAGHTYGANGIWQLNEPGKPYGPSPHGRSWGSTPWTEAMNLPGSRQMGIGRRFMERFEWWRLERHPEWLEPLSNPDEPLAAVACGIPGELRIVYVPMLWDPPAVTRFEEDASYTAYYFDPRTGGETAIGSVTPGEDGQWRPPFPPEVGDWLLVLEKLRD